MADNQVSFTITANTQEAGKAITALQRQLNKISEIKSNDAGIKAQQKEFAEIKKTLDGVIKREKELGHYYNTYASNAKKVATLNEELKETEETLAKFSSRKSELETKSANGTITPTEVNELSRATATVENLERKRVELNADINKYTKRNTDLDKSAQKALSGVVAQYGEIHTDESSILGLKVQAKQETQATAGAEEDLAQTTKQTNNAYADMASNAKKAGDAIKDTAKNANTSKADKQAFGEQAIQQTNNELLRLLATYNKIHETPIVNDQAVDKTIEKAGKLEDAVARIQAILSKDTSKMGFAEMVVHLRDLKEAQKGIETLGMPKHLYSFYDGIVQAIARTNQSMSEYRRNCVSVTKATESSGRVFRRFGKDTKTGVNGLSVMKREFKSLSKAANNVKSSFNSMARDMRSNFKHLITNITKYVLGFRSLFFLVRRLRRYIGEGIKNMAQFNNAVNPVNSNITKLLSSLLYLKNAWATAFSPILSFITPWLSALIDKLAEAGNAFSRFLGNILGQSKVFQAVKVNAADYGKSLERAGGSAGSAAKKQKQLNDRLAAFDDLIVLGVDKDPNGTGSGGGGGSGDNYEPDPNKMFKIVEVANDIKERLKKMWEDADFSNFGTYLAQKIKKGLEDLNSKWPEIQATAEKVGKSFGTFLTGFFSDPSMFAELGKAVAEGLDTVGSAIAGFFEGYEKGSIGQAIAEFFRGIFTNFDWTQAGSNLGEFVTTFFTELATLFREFPTDELVQGIKDFFAGIDWAAVVSSLFSFIFNGISFIGDFLTGLALAIGSIKSDDILAAFEDIDWDEVAKGLGSLIVASFTILFSTVELIHQIGEAILYGIGKAVVTAMEDAGVMDEYTKALEDGDWLAAGKAIIDGLAKGIGDALGDAKEWVAQNIGLPIIEGFCEIFGIASPSKLAETWGEFIIQGLVSGINNLISTVMEPFKQLETDLSTKWNAIKTTASEKWGEIKQKLYEKAGEIKQKLNETWTNIRGDAYAAWVLLRISAVEAFTQLKEALKRPINGVISIVESMINKIIGGINSIVDKLNSLPDLKFTNPFTGSEYKLGFSVPKLSQVSIPRLAQGAVIPPNREFMAVLGDQSHGTNIEAPLDTIKQAVAEVLANNGNAEVIQLLQQLIAVVESKNLTIGDKEIGKANARYVNQQRMIRGASF